MNMLNRDVLFVGVTALTAITQNALMIYLGTNYASLLSAGSVSCANTTSPLGGTWGTLTLAFIIATIVLNFLLLIVVLRKIVQNSYSDSKNPMLNSTSKYVRATFNLMIQSLLMALGTAGYNLFINLNFGSEVGKGNFGEACPTLAGCKDWTGQDGDALWGVNVAAAVLSGVSLLHYGLVSGN